MTVYVLIVSVLAKCQALYCCLYHVSNCCVCNQGIHLIYRISFAADSVL